MITALMVSFRHMIKQLPVLFSVIFDPGSLWLEVASFKFWKLILQAVNFYDVIISLIASNISYFLQLTHIGPNISIFDCMVAQAFINHLIDF